MTLDPAIALLISTGGALLFGSAALHKAAAGGHFPDVLGEYRLVPGRLVTAAAAGVVVAEFALAIALVAGGLDLVAGSGLTGAPLAGVWRVTESWRPLSVVGLRSVAAVGAIALLVLYAAAMEINLLRGRRSIDCGCGGFGRRSRIAQWMVVRNLILAALSGLLELPVATRVLTGLDVLTVLGGVLVAALLYLAADALSAQAAAFELTSAGRS